MSTNRFSRRSLLQGGAAMAGAVAASRAAGAKGLFSSEARAQLAPEQPTVVCLYTLGGYNALFCSADSFIPAGSFSCTSSNTIDLGNGLVVDSTFGALPTFAQQHICTIGVNHGLSSHDAAENACWNDPSGNSYPVQLAAAMGGYAALKCVTVGQEGIPSGSAPPYGGVSMQQISDMGSTIAALGGPSSDPTIPDRIMAANGLSAGTAMSKRRLLASPRSLLPLTDAYGTAVATLDQPPQPFSYTDLATAYGISTTDTSINDIPSKFAAAELMVLAGANVVNIIDTFEWDSHGDSDGSGVRGMMSSLIIPPLGTFLGRMMTNPAYNVVLIIFADFSRSLPGSDHAPNLSATVFGKYVNVGTTGRVNSNVNLTSMPSIPEMWAFLAAAAHCPSQPFGANPHPLVS